MIPALAGSSPGAPFSSNRPPVHRGPLDAKLFRITVNKLGRSIPTRKGARQRRHFFARPIVPRPGEVGLIDGQDAWPRCQKTAQLRRSMH
jgi:hypothetical protein